MKEYWHWLYRQARKGDIPYVPDREQESPLHAYALNAALFVDRGPGQFLPWDLSLGYRLAEFRLAKRYNKKPRPVRTWKGQRQVYEDE